MLDSTDVYSAVVLRLSSACYGLSVVLARGSFVFVMCLLLMLRCAEVFDAVTPLLLGLSFRFYGLLRA